MESRKINIFNRYFSWAKPGALSSMIISSILVLGILICLEIISFNHNIRIDASPGKIYTLADQTKQMLDTIKEDITFISFYNIEQKGNLDEKYEKFSGYCRYIKHRTVDLDRNPGMARMYGVTHAVTVVMLKGKREDIPDLSEENVVNAILRLTSDRKKTVLFSKGHGEATKYMKLRNALQAENWVTDDIYLPEITRIPTDHTVLVISGPENDFHEVELSLMEQYLNEGGNIVAMLEPFVLHPSLEKFLQKNGISLKQDIIVDTRNKLHGGDPLTIFIPYYLKTPFTSILRSPFMFTSARSLEIADIKGDNVFPRIFAGTTTHSWTKTDKAEVMQGNLEYVPNVDRPGPVNVAMWTTVKGKNDKGQDVLGELVCFGDSDFVNDTFYDVMGNKDLFLNTMEWFVKEKNLVSVRPNMFKYPYNFLSQTQGRIIFLVSIIILPFIFLVMGTVVYLYRRARG